jgi:hypothetical protein
VDPVALPITPHPAEAKKAAIAHLTKCYKALVAYNTQALRVECLMKQDPFGSLARQPTFSQYLDSREECTSSALPCLRFLRCKNTFSASYQGWGFLHLLEALGLLIAFAMSLGAMDSGGASSPLASDYECNVMQNVMSYSCSIQARH